MSGINNIINILGLLFPLGIVLGVAFYAYNRYTGKYDRS